MVNQDRLSLILPPSERWLRILDTAAREYWTELGFAEQLRDMLAGSLNEAGEEFIRICRERGIDETFEVVLDFREEAAIIQFVYDCRVPLNPLETENYEVPFSLDETESPDLDSLWLHLIKRRMDRVFFSLEGSRRSLRMVKYRRDEGKTRRLWVMGLAPRLRDGIRLELSSPAPESTAFPEGLLRDTRNGTVLRLDPGSAFIVCRMDGATAFQDIYLEYIDRMGMTSPQRFALLYERLESQDLLAREGERPEGRLQRAARLILSPRLSIPEADRLMDRVHRIAAPLLNPPGAGLLMLAGISGLIPAALHGKEMIALIPSMKGAFLNQPWMTVPVYLLVLLMAFIHELAHGSVCKHYGGRVDRIGVMFYLAMFIFYCDTSSAWNFPRVRQRVMVSLAGPMATFAFLGGAVWVWGLTAGNGGPPAMIAATVALLSLTTLAMNLNPFLRMDAYYVLMDLSGIPNLRTRSFAYLRGLLGILLGARREALPDANSPIRHRAYFLGYGLLGALVSGVFFLWPVAYAARRFLANGRTSGTGIYLGIAVFLLLARLGLAAWRRAHARSHRSFKIT